ncbi:MAG TPA: sigma-54 dependent transcriptional regulator [Gemmatimonadales bacterium]|nr:sigma-54 dependent transcriptional regulator [Gemmatimonadales bacterium]
MPDVATLLPLSPEIRSSLRIFIADDERSLRESCANVLKLAGYNVTTSGRGQEALEILKRTRFDVVLLDLYMTQVPGMELLRLCLETNRDALVIVMTGTPSVASSIEALRAGAWDYLPKPFSATHLEILLGRAAHTVMVARETRSLQEEFEKHHGNSEKVSVLGAAPAFRRAIELARRVAATDASVFITGESGSGKELIAQFIHAHSRRSSRGLVAVNCAALPEALLESEMFGHVRGAFTGAVRDKPGLLEAANGGTLLLDELVEMSKPIQAKLLRVIQDGVVRRVGSETTDAVVNVRFIACTNGNPEEAVAAGTLREDLYYRLRVVPIHVPPLRERREDIPVLANHFLTHYWRKHRESSDAPPRISPAAMRAICGRPWKGNVRELQNVIEHTVVLVEPGSDIQPSDIPVLGGAVNEDLPAEPAVGAQSAPESEAAIDQSYHVARERLLAQFERTYLEQLVNLADGNMSRAARIAGVDRTTLYRLMERQGLHRRLLVGPVEGDGSDSPQLPATE